MFSNKFNPLVQRIVNFACVTQVEFRWGCISQNVQVCHHYVFSCHLLHLFLHRLHSMVIIAWTPNSVTFAAELWLPYTYVINTSAASLFDYPKPSLLL